MLIILDGYNIGKPYKGNAVWQANTPVLDRLKQDYPWTWLKTSGTAVGLPEGQMGNSEVGHLNLGAGRVVDQDILRISKSLEDGSLRNNPYLLRFFKAIKKTVGRLHFIGLLSHGGVHSLQDHLYGFITLAEEAGLTGYIHAITDGRDTPPTSGYQNIQELLDFLKNHPAFRLASVIGRYYTMDRDRRWDRTQRGYELMTLGKGELTNDPVQAMQRYYDKGVGDEFMEPLWLGNPEGTIQDGDGILFFNFRADRMRQIVRSFMEVDFSGFTRKVTPKVHLITLTQYHQDYPIPCLFPPERLSDILAAVFSEKKIKNLRIAETEKYAHVTFFFNGGEDHIYPYEERLLIPSPKVATYDLKPEMSAFEVTNKLLEVMEAFDVVILNYANCDMVGHTGVIPAAIKAVEAVDTCLGRILDRIIPQGVSAIITSDHGNAEKMLDEEGHPYTAHTLEPVPCYFVTPNLGKPSTREGALCDVAPTLLKFLRIPQPKEMTGKPLILF